MPIGCHHLGTQFVPALIVQHLIHSVAGRYQVANKWELVTYGSIELLISNIGDAEGWLVLGHNFSLVTGIFALKPLVFSNDTTDFTLMPRKYLRRHVLHPFVQ